ncbi:hypothetical protein LCGC14_1650050, partial [marine sediment metagenome]
MITVEELKELEIEVSHEFPHRKKDGWVLDLNSEVLATDPSWVSYYTFLQLLAEKMNPKLIVELGTNAGSSAVYMKHGCPPARVITVDITDRCSDLLKKHSIEFIQEDSIKAADKIPDNIDLLFIDTEHTNEQAKA